MLKEYQELQQDHTQFKDGIVTISKLVSIMANNHKDTIDENESLKIKLATIAGELTQLTEKLVGIGNRYINKDGIIETLLEDNEANTATYLEITYEYGDLADSLNRLIKEDITELANDLNDTSVLPTLNELYNL